MDGSRQRTGFSYKAYFESPRFADVKIRYGNESPKRKFSGHAVILCVGSRWFEKALTGVFKESKSRVIDLSGDDSGAVYNMLKFIYGVPLQELGSEFKWEHFTSSVNTWQVADKYDVPELCKEIEQWWSASLSKYMERFYQKGDQEEDPTLRKEPFTKFVLASFDLANGGPQHMKDTLLRILFRASLERDNFFDKPAGDKEESLIHDALSSNAELAQGLLFYLRNNEDGARLVQTGATEYVECGRCGTKFPLEGKTRRDTWVGSCPRCGASLYPYHRFSRYYRFLR